MRYDWDRQDGVLPTTWIVFVHLTGRASKISPLQLFLVASNVEAEGEVGLLCLSIPSNTKVRQTFMGSPREPRLDDRWHN